VQKLEQQTTGDIANADGTGATILLAENHYLDLWNYPVNYPSSNPTSEFYCAIVWQDNPAGTPQVGLDTPFTPGPQLNVAHARPSSLHPGGFQVVFCDGHTQFVSESIAYDVYCRLMSSNGRKYKQAGTTSPYSAGILTMQSTPLSADSY
jgi:prepilin-type processing-associated H-X9-DG protein